MQNIFFLLLFMLPMYELTFPAISSGTLKDLSTLDKEKSVTNNSVCNFMDLMKLVEQRVDFLLFENYFKSVTVENCPPNFFLEPLLAVLERRPVLCLFLGMKIFENLTENNKKSIFTRISASEDLLKVFGWAGVVIQNSVIDQNFVLFFHSVNENSKSELLLQLLTCKKFLSLDSNTQRNLRKIVPVLESTANPITGPFSDEDLVFCVKENCSLDKFINMFKRQRFMDIDLLPVLLDHNRADIFDFLVKVKPIHFPSSALRHEWVLKYIDHKNTFVFDYFFKSFKDVLNKEYLLYQILRIKSNSVNLKKILDFALYGRSEDDKLKVFIHSLSCMFTNQAHGTIDPSRIGNLDVTRYFLENGFLFTSLFAPRQSGFHFFAMNSHIDAMKVFFEVVDSKYSEKTAKLIKSYFINTLTMHGNSPLESLVLITKTNPTLIEDVLASAKFLLDHGANIFQNDTVNGDAVINSFFPSAVPILCNLFIELGILDPVRYRSYAKRSLLMEMILLSQWQRALDLAKNYKFDMYEKEEFGFTMLELVEKSRTMTEKKMLSNRTSHSELEFTLLSLNNFLQFIYLNSPENVKFQNFCDEYGKENVFLSGNPFFKKLLTSISGIDNLIIKYDSVESCTSPALDAILREDLENVPFEILKSFLKKNNLDKPELAIQRCIENRLFDHLVLLLRKGYVYSNALELAVELGDKRFIQLILANPLLYEDSNVFNILEIALMKDNFDLTTLRPYLKNSGFLHKAVSTDDKVIEDKVIKISLDIISKYNEEMTLESSSLEQLITVDLKDSNGDTALMTAIRAGNLRAVDWLLRVGASVSIKNQQNESFLSVAASVSEKVLDLERFVLSYASSKLATIKWQGGKTLLQIAFLNKNFVLFAKLLAYSNVNSKDDLGYTILHYAVINGDIEYVRILLENGASPFERSNMSTTPLHLAAEMGLTKEITLLYKFVSSLKEPFILNYFVNCPDRYGRTALMMAAWKNKFQSFKTLLSFPELNINAQDFSNNTVLHWIARYSGVPFIEEVLKREPEWELKNNKNRTAVMSACDLKNIPIVLYMWRNNIGKEYVFSFKFKSRSWKLEPQTTPVKKQSQKPIRGRKPKNEQKARVLRSQKEIEVLPTQEKIEAVPSEEEMERFLKKEEEAHVPVVEDKVVVIDDKVSEEAQQRALQDLDYVNFPIKENYDLLMKQEHHRHMEAKISARNEANQSDSSRMSDFQLEMKTLNTSNRKVCNASYDKHTVFEHLKYHFHISLATFLKLCNTFKMQDDWSEFHNLVVNDFKGECSCKSPNSSIIHVFSLTTSQYFSKKELHRDHGRRGQWRRYAKELFEKPKIEPRFFEPVSTIL